MPAARHRLRWVAAAAALCRAQVTHLAEPISSPLARVCAVSRHRKVMGVYETYPVLADDVFVAPNASVIGDVSIGGGSSVWYGAILRGAAEPPMCLRALRRHTPRSPGAAVPCGPPGRLC